MEYNDNSTITTPNEADLINLTENRTTHLEEEMSKLRSDF